MAVTSRLGVHSLRMCARAPCRLSINAQRTHFGPGRRTREREHFRSDRVPWRREQSSSKAARRAQFSYFSYVDVVRPRESQRGRLLRPEPRSVYLRTEGPVLFHVGTAFVTPTEGQ
jgi:hypothetical protein